MADEEETQTEENEQDPVAALQRKSKSQLTILFAACASSMVFLGLLGFTYTHLSQKLLSMTQEPVTEMKNLSGLVSDEYSNLTMAVEFYNHQMESLGQRLDEIDPAIDEAQFDKLEEVIIAQEKDFQRFLGATQDAVFGLSEMVTGSRSWRDDFRGKLDLAIASSEARELSIAGDGETEAPQQSIEDISSAP